MVGIYKIDMNLNWVFFNTYTVVIRIGSVPIKGIIINIVYSSPLLGFLLAGTPYRCFWQIKTDLEGKKEINESWEKRMNVVPFLLKSSLFARICEVYTEILLFRLQASVFIIFAG